MKLAPEIMFKVLSSPELARAAADLLGADELVSHGIWNSRPKTPGSRFTDTPMHQDAQYFPEQAGNHILTTWFPLHAVDEARSCLAVTPKFDQNFLYDVDDSTDTGFLGIAPGEAKKLERLPIPMEAGDVLCFSEMTPHGAMPNATDLMRWSMDMRYVAAERTHPDAIAQGLQVLSQDPAKLTSYEAWHAKWEGRTGY